jgi:hypothetical protein
MDEACPEYPTKIKQAKHPGLKPLSAEEGIADNWTGSVIRQ